MSNFLYKGRLSSEFNLRVKSKQRPLLPDIRQSYVEVLGRDGSYDFSDNKLEDRIIEVSCAFIGSSVGDLRYRIRELAAWLYGPEPELSGSVITQNWNNMGGAGWLIFDDEPDIKYKAKVANKIDLEQTATLGEFSIYFRCEPYGYSVETAYSSYDGVNPGLTIFKEDKDISSPTHNQLIATTGEDKYTTILHRKIKPTDKFIFDNITNSLTASINNFGTAPVRPRVALVGITGDFININGTTYNIENDPNLLYTYINYDEYSCYAYDPDLIDPVLNPDGRINHLDRISGSWWQLNPGYNTINITGTFQCESIQFIFNAKFI